MSATRSSSSSLRRRLIWTAVSTAIIGLVSVALVAIGGRAPVQLAIQAPRQQNEGEAPPEAKEARPLSDVGSGAAADSPPGPKAAGDFHSARYGYSVSLSGTPWTRWENLNEVVPEAEWGALIGNYGRLLVISVSLAGLEPWPEAIDSALLARIGIGYPNDQLTDFRPIERDGATGHSFRLRREVAGVPNAYRLWLLRRGDFAYLFAAWVDEVAAKNAGVAEPASADDDLIQKIGFDHPAPRAANFAELNVQQRQSHSAVYNDLGMFAFNARDFNSAIQSFRKALELQPDDAAMLMNLVNSLIESGQVREALAELDKNAGRFPKQLDLGAARAYLLAELGETEAALAAYSALFASGYRAEGPFAGYVTLLAKNGRLDDASTAIERFLSHQDSFAIRKLQAAVARQRGDVDHAIELLVALQKDRPLNAELEYDLAECYIAKEQYQDALAVCQRLISNRYETATTYLLQARSQFALRWYQEARASLEAAIKREPGNREAQELLTVVAGMLGEGSNFAVKEPIEGVPDPETSFEKAPTLLDRADLKSFGACYLNREVAIEFEPGKCFKMTDRRRIRVLDASGILRFSTIQLPFDPLGEQLFVNSLRVLDETGKEVSQGKASDYYVIDGTRSQPATHGKMLNIPVPALQPGRTIELVFTRSDVAPPSELPYVSHTFSSEVPVLSAALWLKVDPTAIKYRATPTVKLAKLPGGLRWSIENPLVYRDEPLPQPKLAYLPRVEVGAISASWEALARGYLAQIADRLAVDPAVDTLAKKLTADLSNDDERVAALVHYVQDHLTYKAIEFGRRARIPNKPADILKLGYGDCKDHSLLLVQLLKSVGFEARLALANLDEPVDPEFPSLEQFNHVVVYVPKSDGLPAGDAVKAGNAPGRVFDCTDKECDLLAIGAPLDLGGTKILVLDERDAKIVELPAYGEDSSRIEVNRTVRIENQTDAAVTETVIVEGYHAAFLRNLLKETPAANRAALLQEHLSPLGGDLQIQTVEIEHLMERHQPLVFKAKYLVRNRFHAAGETLLGQLPALWERMYVDVPAAPGRRTPFAVEYPLTFKSEIDFVAPHGYEAEYPAGMNHQRQSAYVAWKLQTALKAEGLHLDFELKLPTGQFPAAEYAAYEQDLEQSMTALAQSIVLKLVK